MRLIQLIELSQLRPPPQVRKFNKLNFRPVKPGSRQTLFNFLNFKQGQPARETRPGQGMLAAISRPAFMRHFFAGFFTHPAFFPV